MKNWALPLILVFAVMAGLVSGCQTSPETEEGIIAKNLWTYDTFIDVRLKDKSIQSQRLKSNQRVKISPDAEALQVRSTGSFDYERPQRAYVEVRKPDGSRIAVTEPDRWFSL